MKSGNTIKINNINKIKQNDTIKLHGQVFIIAYAHSTVGTILTSKNSFNLKVRYGL